jgi:hypothetical protein
LQVVLRSDSFQFPAGNIRYNDYFSGRGFLMAAVSNPPLQTPVRQLVERAIQNRQAILGDPLLDLRTVRAALGNCSYSFLRKLISEGTLKTFRIGAHGHHRVRQSELQKLLAKGDHHNG